MFAMIFSLQIVSESETFIPSCFHINFKMPKTAKETARGFLLRVTQLYPKVFRADDSVLFCTVCETAVNAKQIFLVKQHLETSKHKREAEKKNQVTAGTSQSFLTQYQTSSDTSTSSKLSEFNMEVTKMFIEANIPIHIQVLKVV